MTWIDLVCREGQNAFAQGSLQENCSLEEQSRATLDLAFWAKALWSLEAALA